MDVMHQLKSFYLIWDCLSLCWLHRLGDVLLRCVSPVWCVCVAFPQGDVVLCFPPRVMVCCVVFTQGDGLLCCLHPGWWSVVLFFLRVMVCCVVFTQGDGVLCCVHPGWWCVVLFSPRVMVCCVVSPRVMVFFSFFFLRVRKNNTNRVTLCCVFTQGDDLLCFYWGWCVVTQGHLCCVVTQGDVLLYCHPGWCSVVFLPRVKFCCAFT